MHAPGKHGRLQTAPSRPFLAWWSGGKSASTNSFLSFRLSCVNLLDSEPWPMRQSQHGVPTLSSAIGPSRSSSRIDKVAGLYDSGLFLRAYQESKDYWMAPARLTDLSIDELVLGLRLAARLGGVRLSRWMRREVFKRAPSHPKVRYYAANIQVDRK